jgi:ABC-2 type transport system ATP-binding protein
MIYETAERGITVFVTTHYLEEAEYCNRVSIMVDGEMRDFDTPQALMKKYKKSTMNDVFLHMAVRSKRKE